eukprot:gb/GECG01012720.1/.p1 GENE.gb/GECG01012720.1/~~gb/GECG01012720.1/.p1  ORF type:complete len:219 (+),score=27.18 gb/GECG01012720.1/:1-657(+)
MMVGPNVCLLAAIAALVLGTNAAATRNSNPPCHIYNYNHIETPCFHELENKTIDGMNYAVRVYGKEVNEFWTVARVQTESFDNAESTGFHKNFNYISGKNSMNKEIPMTSPVLARTNDSTNWKISFFVPSSLFSDRSEIPTSNEISIESGSNLKMAATEFGGFANKTDFINYSAQLKDVLRKAGHKLVEGSDWSEAWAQYDSPFTLFGRHNEVWLQVQ